MSTNLSVPGVHPLDSGEAALMCQWAADEGWNPGLHDAEVFYQADPEGFFGWNSDGHLAGTISAVRYGQEYAFVGFFIVRPGLRGHLIGPKLAEAAMARISGVPTGIDGVLENVGKYERIYGFRQAWKNIRFELANPLCTKIDSTLRPLASFDMETLLSFDRRFFPAKRESFVRRWISQPGSHALAATSPNGELEGYGVIRPCVKGWKIGPLFATAPDIAESLFLGLCSTAGTGPVFLDVPEPNSSALTLVNRFGMTPSFATARMFRDSPKPVDLDGIFGITSFELG